MEKKVIQFNGVLFSNLIDDDFSNAIKAVVGCHGYFKVGYPIDEVLSDSLYYICKRFVDDYDSSLIGK